MSNVTNRPPLGSLLASRDDERDEAFGRPLDVEPDLNPPDDAPCPHEGPEDTACVEGEDVTTCRDCGAVVHTKRCTHGEDFGSIKTRATDPDQRRIALNVIHSNLTRLHVTRRGVEDALAGRTLTLVKGTELGYGERSVDGKRVHLKIDPPIALAEAVPWERAPESREIIAHVGFLSTSNSKMACPSFAIPAGAIEAGGSCVGAGAAQTTVEEKRRLQYAKDVGQEVDIENTICGSCVAGDTRVLVKDRGYVRIDELVGQEFVAWSGKGWRKTTAKLTAVKPTATLTTSWGQTVRLTLDHQILTKDDAFIAAADLEVGDRLVFEPPREPGFPTHAALPAASIEQQRYRTAVEEHFPDEWSYNVGLVLGYVLGNGTVSRGPYPTISVTAGEEDADDLRNLQSIVAGWCGTQSEVCVTDGKPSNLCANSKPVARIAWRLLGLSEFVATLGLDKSIDPSLRRAPESVFTASVDGVCGFLSGLFSTDGSVLFRQTEKHDKLEVTLTSVSLPLLRDAQLLLAGLNIRATICEYAATNELRASSGHRLLYKLNISSFNEVKKFEAQIGLFNARKAKKLRESIAAFRQQRPARESYPTVKSIEPSNAPAEPVYDLLDVGEEHQFFANGLSVHNCYATGGSFQRATVQLEEVARFWYLNGLLRTSGGAQTLVEALSACIEGELETGQWKEEKHPEGAFRFFRLHDSGDFFSHAYANAWIEVARRFPNILFWAPTRTWAVKRWRTFWEEAELPKNLIIRPSAYHFDDASPKIEGLAAGTTSLYAIERNGDVVAQVDPTRAQWNCVAKGSLVPIRGVGYLPIEEVVARVANGARLETLTRIGWHRVLSGAFMGTRTTLSLQTRAGLSIRVTPEHRIASGDAWVAAEELEPSAVVSVGPESEEALPMSDGVSEKWQLIGYVVGDGHFNKEGRIELQAGIAKSQDMHRLDDAVKRLFGKGGTFSEHRNERPEGNSRFPAGISYSVRVTWSGKELQEMFATLGYRPGVGSSVRRVPPVLFTAPRGDALGFISGLISADGYVNARADGRAEVSLSTTSRGLAEDVQQLIALLGGRATISERTRKPYRNLFTVTMQTARTIAILREAQLVNPAKRAALAACAVPEHRRHRDTRVASIIADGVVSEVYDIEVEGVHEFIANGIVVHNCQVYNAGKGKDMHSCPRAHRPGLDESGVPKIGSDGELVVGALGCRTCWLHPKITVSYTAH